jgi:hypothetical protein
MSHEHMMSRSEALITGCQTGFIRAPCSDAAPIPSEGEANKLLRMTSTEMALLASIVSAKLVTKGSILTSALQQSQTPTKQHGGLTPIAPVDLELDSATSAKCLRQRLRSVCDDSGPRFKTCGSKVRARPFARHQSDLTCPSATWPSRPHSVCQSLVHQPSTRRASQPSWISVLSGANGVAQGRCVRASAHGSVLALSDVHKHVSLVSMSVCLHSRSSLPTSLICPCLLARSTQASKSACPRRIQGRRLNKFHLSLTHRGQQCSSAVRR